MNELNKDTCYDMFIKHVACIFISILIVLHYYIFANEIFVQFAIKALYIELIINKQA